ncbi:MAG: PepSY-like domain-containing protein [Bacteroidales bacterium]|nr:PepSY-like domain-containing protein [Bacteroidales bacterium]
MKLIIFAIMLFGVSTLCFSKGNIFVEGKDKLPIKAQNFINYSFGAERIVYVKESRSIFLRKKFLAVFSNGMKIEFDSRGNWVDIKFVKDGLPNNIVSQKILDYLKENYVSAFILELEKMSRNMLRVLLSNKRELYFNQFGDRVFIDV